jgi:hypothetical protein
LMSRRGCSLPANASGLDPTAPQQVAVLTAVKQMSARARRLGGEAAAERAAAELALREELRCGRVP